MSEQEIRARPRRATLKDVARSVGVHVSTVSRALNPKTSHLITAEVRDRIKTVCAELDYLPNRTAMSLRTRRTMTVGVVIPDITNQLFPPIIRGIDDGLGERGYVAIIANTDSDPARKTKMVETLLARSVDGLIMANVQRRDSVVDSLAARAFEVVTVNRRVDDPAVPSVVNDDEGGIRATLAHLVGLGHRSIAHIAAPLDVSTGFRRAEAFRQALAGFDLDARACPVVVGHAISESEGARCAAELIDRGAGVTAFLCANDVQALGAMAALRRYGLDCPGDVSVTGFNDMPFVDRLDPSLTTVRVRHYDIGNAAARLIADRLEAPSRPPPHHAVLPVDLIVRASSGPVAARRAAAAGGLGALQK